MTHAYSAALAGLFPHLLPEMVLVLCACLLFLGGLYRSDRNLGGGVALAGLLLALALFFLTPARQNLTGGADGSMDGSMDGAVFAVPLLFDALAQLTRVLAIATGIVFVLLAWNDPPPRHVADHHACFLIIIAGLCLVGASNDLVTLFLALEMVSIPTYVLLYLPRHDDAAQEASLKYFLLSIFSSGILLFGFSYLFGLAGTTNIAGILQVLYGASAEEGRAISGLAQISMLMISAGLGFRITAVPFHFYAPDVFQGTSTSGAAFLSYIPKIAGFIALVRVFGFVVPEGVTVPAGRMIGLGLSDQAQVPIFFWFLAALSMTVGNILALLQENLKRLLAYSSVAHAGYMLVALASAPYLGGTDVVSNGITALLFYLIAYGAMTFGIFSVLLMLHRPERPVENVDDLAGLGKSHPGIALMLTVLLFSFIGIPLTAGFMGKFFVFFGAMSVQGPLGWLYALLALIGVINAAIGGWYYLRIITVMYLRTAVKPVETAGSLPGLAALITCVVLTLGLSIPPGANWVLSAARKTSERTVAGQPRALSQTQP